MSMTGDFIITKEFLKTLSPCLDRYEWFCDTYPSGGKYQEILDELCRFDRFDDAYWLLNLVGSTTDTLELDSTEDEEKIICFAGNILAKGYLSLKTIKAGGSIKVCRSIKARESIESGCDISADDYIWAGEHIKVINSIRAGMSVFSGKYIDAGGYIDAGWYIKAGGCIKVGKSIKAGTYIHSLKFIEAGEGYGVYAGLNEPLSGIKKHGFVRAKSKPENLICGYWEGE